MDVKILIVDDEKDVTDSLQRHLRLEGYEVFAVNNPLEAMYVIAKNNIKVVIADISMPEMNGVDLLKQIKESNGTIRVIMMTGYVTFINLISCLSHGAGDCLFKPFEDLEEVSNAVKREVEKLDKWNKILAKSLKTEQGIFSL